MLVIPNRHPVASPLRDLTVPGSDVSGGATDGDGRRAAAPRQAPAVSGAVTERSSTITVRYDPPPIPIRDCDWTAIRDAANYEPGDPIGHGPTEAAAIADLLIAEELHA